MGFDPQQNRGVMHSQMSAYPSQIEPVNIHLQGLLLQAFRIAFPLRLRGVFSFAEGTQVAL